MRTMNSIIKKQSRLFIAGYEFCAVSLLLAGFATSGAYAGPNIAGTVEAGYNYNLTIPSKSSTNQLHSYDFKSKSITLNNAHLAFSGSDSASGVGYAVETDFGSDALANASLSGGQANSTDVTGVYSAANYFDIQEAYLTYGFGPDRALSLKAGKYATYEGIEVIEGGSNPTVTRGFLFGLAEPLTHTGIEVSYASGILDFHLGAINGWDKVVANNVLGGVAKIGVNLGEPLALTVSGIFGPEVPGSRDIRTSLDATGVTKSISMTDLWFQVNFGMQQKATATGGDASWFGIGVQPLVHINELFGLGLRYEYFNDADGVRTASPGELILQNISLAPTFWLAKNLTARGELRMDMASEKIYLDQDSKPTDSQIEIAADLIAAF
jgi:hypothetical protein